MRPKSENPRCRLVTIKLTDEEFGRWRTAAGPRALSVWIREVCFGFLDEVHKLAKEISDEGLQRQQEDGKVARTNSAQLNKMPAVHRMGKVQPTAERTRRTEKIISKPPKGSKWGYESWRQVSERLGRNPTEAEWELYQKGRL
jgi:hypothetical protein